MSNVFSTPEKIIGFKERCIPAWKALDEYTQKKYSKYIQQRIEEAKQTILRIKYENNLMNQWQRMIFPFQSFRWRVKFHLRNLLDC